jgi:hypothetical protein
VNDGAEREQKAMVATTSRTRVEYWLKRDGLMPDGPSAGCPGGLNVPFLYPPPIEGHEMQPRLGEV